LQLDKRIQDDIGKLDLAFGNDGSSEKDVLYKDHVGKDCLGMILFEKIGGKKKSSLTFFIQYGV